jgi:hypothetical protein
VTSISPAVALGKLTGVCNNPQVDMDRPAVTELMSEVAAAVASRAAVVRSDVYQVIIREIPQLRDDKPLLALLASSVDSNVDTCLQIMQHRIDLADVAAPAAAVEYARRLAQRGTPLTALLRAYRVGHTCFSDWVLTELARQADDADMITAATLSMSKIVAGYIDQTSEEMVAAYTQERENWLRNRSAARTARIRDLLSGERIDVTAAEATLGYRLRQYHVGLVCWAGDAAKPVDEITRLERAITHVAEQAACPGEPVFLPRDESSAWAWLPLGIRDRFDAAAASTAGLDGDICVRRRGSRDGGVSPDPPAGPGRAGGRAGRGFSRAAGGDLRRGGAGGDDARLRRPAPGLGAGHAGGPGHRRRASRPAARHHAGLPRQRGAATRRRPNGCSCTRTPSSTGSARPRRASAGRWPITAATWNSRCRSATGSARRCCGPRKGKTR